MCSGSEWVSIQTPLKEKITFPPYLIHPLYWIQWLAHAKSHTSVCWLTEYSEGYLQLDPIQFHFILLMTEENISVIVLRNGAEGGTHFQVSKLTSWVKILAICDANLKTWNLLKGGKREPTSQSGPLTSTHAHCTMHIHTYSHLQISINSFKRKQWYYQSFRSSLQSRYI